MIPVQEHCRPFPFPTRLFHRESLTSYTQRLLARNHCDSSHQKELINAFQGETDSTDEHDAWVRAIAVKTGRTGLLHPEHASGWQPIRAEEFNRPSHGRFACTLCTHGQIITQTSHFDDIVCVRHRRWVGLWGAPGDQLTASPEAITAQSAFAKLRRARRINLRLYSVAARALAITRHPRLAIEDAEPRIFATAVGVINEITRPGTAQILLGEPFAVAFATLREAVEGVAPEATDSLTRAIWVYLHPTITEIRNATGTGSAIPADVSGDLFPMDALTVKRVLTEVLPLEPIANYFAQTGDTPATAGHLFSELIALRSPDSFQHPVPYSCANGHTFDYLPPMYDLTTPRGWMTPACGLCTTKPVAAGDDFAAVCPDLVGRFDLHRNGGLTASDIGAATQTSYWWICPDGHSHRASPANMTMGVDSCPLSSNRTVVVGINSFIETHPELAARSNETWDDHSSPAHNSSGSKTLARWTCDRGHVYWARYWELSRGKVTCDKCKKEAKRFVAHENSLAARFPEVTTLWHPTLNGSLTAADVTPGAKTVVWWRCAQGHNNQGRVDKRVQGQRCGVCTNKTLNPGVNDLGTSEPLLTLEYSEKNPLRAKEIFSSTHKLHWECFAHGHLHAQTAQHRRESHGCPLCAPEERILNAVRA